MTGVTAWRNCDAHTSCGGSWRAVRDLGSLNPTLFPPKLLYWMLLPMCPQDTEAGRVPTQSRSEKPTSPSQQNLKKHTGTFKRSGSVGLVNHPHFKAKTDLVRKQNSGANVIIRRQSFTWGIALDNYTCVWDTEHGTSQIRLG